LPLSVEVMEERQLLTGGPPAFGPGDVLVGVTGAVQWRHADGSLVATLPTTPGQPITGMAFDRAGNLYATGWQAEQIDRFAPSGAALPTFGGGFNQNPESIVFDAAGNAYVGQSDGLHRVLKFDAAGNLVASYQVQIESRGSDWLELAPDQRTLYYTSEGHSVKRYDVVAGKQLPDFATGLPGDEAFQLQLLPDGSVLVADDHWILRLDATGKIVQSYGYDPANQWFNLVLDPDGKTFWSTDQGNGRVARFDIATGQMLESFNTDPGGAFGLAVVGEIRAATAASLTLTTIAAPPEATVGQPITYTVQAANHGPAAAVGTWVVVALPAGATLVSGTTSQGGTPVMLSGVVAFWLGDLASGASAEVKAVFRADAPGTLTGGAAAGTWTPTTTKSAATVTWATSVAARPPDGPPPDVQAPVVTSATLGARRLAGSSPSMVIVVGFSQTMSAARAVDLRNYRLSGPMPPRNPWIRPSRGRTIAIRRAIYDPATRSVTLVARQPLSLRWVYQLVISAGPAGLASSAGTPLAGQPGQPGTDYTGYVAAAGSTAARASTRRPGR
jgi:uncharacterized repeat protein (TIGR01451 family)